MNRQNSSNLSGSENNQNSDRRISYLKKVFLSNLSFNWSLDEIAQRVNISVSHLNRLFKAGEGLPPLQFLREMRLNQAANLLKNSFLSIKEIRFRTGLSDKSSFIKDFKKKYGMTPSVYRKQSDKSDTVGNLRNY
jgi:AraC-like DNA-binding protein